jgi:toxin-antitoxin system PIN domain toxin
MKLADSNVWIALAISGHEHHAQVSAWFVQQSPRDVAFCRMTQLALLRLLTTQAVLNAYGLAPLTNAQAWKVYDDLLSDAKVTFTEEPLGLEVTMKRLSSGSTASPKQWMDAYLASMALDGGHQLVTIDTGFTQFGGLDLVILKK